METLPIDSKASSTSSRHPDPDVYDPICAKLARQILENPTFANCGTPLKVDGASIVIPVDGGCTLSIDASNFNQPSSVTSLVKIAQHFDPEIKALRFVFDEPPTQLSQILQSLPDIDYVAYKNQHVKKKRLNAGFVWIKAGENDELLFGIRREKIPMDSPVLQPTIEGVKHTQFDPIISITTFHRRANELQWRTALWGTPQAFDNDPEQKNSPWNVMMILDFLGLSARKKEFDESFLKYLSTESLSHWSLDELASAISDGTLPNTEAWFKEKAIQELRTIISLPHQFLNDKKIDLWERAQQLLEACPDRAGVASQAIGLANAKEVVMATTPTRVIKLEPPGVGRPGARVISELKKALGLSEDEEIKASSFPPNTLVNIGCLTLKAGDAETLEGTLAVPFSRICKRNINRAFEATLITPEVKFINPIAIPLNLTLKPNWTSKDVERHFWVEFCYRPRTLGQQARAYFAGLNHWFSAGKFPVKVTLPPLNLLLSSDRLPYKGTPQLPGLTQLEFQEIGTFLNDLPPDFDWASTHLEIVLDPGDMSESTSSVDSDSEEPPEQGTHLDSLKRLLEKPMQSLSLICPDEELLGAIKDLVIDKKLVGIHTVPLRVIAQAFNDPEQLKHLKNLTISVNKGDMADYGYWLKKLSCLDTLCVDLFEEDNLRFSKGELLFLKELPNITALRFGQGCDHVDQKMLEDIAGALPNLVFLDYLALPNNRAAKLPEHFESTLIKPFVPVTT